jgi:polyisoprenoid-binding protein YceI
MTSKVLPVTGVRALLALVGGSIAALVVVDPRLRITVADEEDAARRGPDPLALVAADVSAVREEVREPGAGVDTQLQALHDALAESAAEREAALKTEIGRLFEEVSSLRAGTERDETAATRSRADVLATLAALGERFQPLADVVNAGAVQPVVLAPLEFPEVVALATVVETAHATAPATAPVTAPVEPARNGFLSFQIPTHAFASACDERQHFAIVPSLARLGFDAKSTLHGFSGATSVIEGEVTAKLARPADGCRGEVTARAESLDTGVEARDESMREVLEPGKYPEIAFEWTAFEYAEDDESARKVAGVADGKLGLHGVAREIATPVTVAVDAS